MIRYSQRTILALVGGTLAATAAFAVNPKSPETKSNRPVILASPTAEVIADSVRVEQDAVLRRYSICDKLRKLGEETNNPSLVQQAADLETQVRTIYDARVARLGVKGAPKADDEPTVAGLAVAPAAPVASGGSR